MNRGRQLDQNRGKNKEKGREGGKSLCRALMSTSKLGVNSDPTRGNTENPISVVKRNDA